jgi:hypothetical protein
VQNTNPESDLNRIAATVLGADSMELLRQLTDGIGPRIVGSSATSEPRSGLRRSFVKPALRMSASKILRCRLVGNVDPRERESLRQSRARCESDR